MDEDSLRSFTKQENLIKSCIQLGNALGDVSAEAEMQDLLTQFMNIKSAHLRSMQALADMRKPQEEAQEQIQDLFEEALTNASNARASHASEGSAIEDEDTQDSNLGERSFILSQAEGIPVDPLTKLKIKQPARNSVCHHIYEYDIIMSYLNQYLKARKKKKVKCPYIGCMNNDVKLEHIAIDEKLKRKIAAMQQHEDEGFPKANASIVSI